MKIDNNTDYYLFIYALFFIFTLIIFEYILYKK